MAEHHFRYSTRWRGGRNAVGEIDCGALETRVSIATGMGGPGVGTNPDEMLLGAAATCYVMTLAAMIERAELAVTELSLTSELTVADERGGYVARRIVHRPRVTLAGGGDAAGLKRLNRLVGMADRRCMISNALHGNVEIVLDPRVEQAG